MGNKKMAQFKAGGGLVIFGKKKERIATVSKIHLKEGTIRLGTELRGITPSMIKKDLKGKIKRDVQKFLKG